MEILWWTEGKGLVGQYIETGLRFTVEPWRVYWRAWCGGKVIATGDLEYVAKRCREHVEREIDLAGAREAAAVNKATQHGESRGLASSAEAGLPERA